MTESNSELAWIWLVTGSLIAAGIWFGLWSSYGLWAALFGWIPAAILGSIAGLVVAMFWRAIVGLVFLAIIGVWLLTVL